MKRLSSQEIRQSFLDYFARHGHTVVQSSSLIPHGDPTLLFTNAGMVQFKDVFLGREKRPYSRAVTAQKAVRAGGKHNDLDQVGRTARHHTFFEMMGNFSFGDYFKEEAISLAFGYITQVLDMPVDRLWASVFTEDDEAADIWSGYLPKERIVRFGAADNFWEMGGTGPCGPCSEIFFDRGEAFSCGTDCHLEKCACDRYLEFWNLVFMQYDRDERGEMTPLPKPSIDTGMGLERVASILQGVDSNWETDLFVPIIGKEKELAAHPEQAGPDDFGFRVVADHVRAGTFLIADGVLPSNEGRGYVLRRILRRAVRVGKSLALGENFLATLAPVVVGVMASGYPELKEREALVLGVLKAEEARFAETLEDGGRLLEQAMAALSPGERLPGEVCFLLYDTYGFPIDLTEEIATAEGHAIDRSGFEKRLAEQRRRARAARGAAGSVQSRLSAATAGLPQTAFEGYSGTSGQGRVLALFRDGEPCEVAEAGGEVAVILDRTPFYGEGGGQVGDRGRLGSGGGEVAVEDTLRLSGGRIVHLGRVKEGRLQVGDEVEAEVEGPRRAATRRNHTATHLLHRALRDLVGVHVHQAGSVVSPDRLRFDFTHFEALEEDVIRAVEDAVNGWVLEDLPVSWQVMDLTEAKKLGAMALFEEKYGDRVRVVEIEGTSRELCGGTHVDRTGQIGLFHILSESSVGTGVRRIEAVTGLGVMGALRSEKDRTARLSATAGVPPAELVEFVGQTLEEVTLLRQELDGWKRKNLRTSLDAAMSEGTTVSRARVTRLVVSQAHPKDLRHLADVWRTREGQGVLLLASVGDGHVDLLVAVSEGLSAAVQAGRLVNAMARVVGGKGGGRPDLAQGGGKQADQLELAMEKAMEMLSAAQSDEAGIAKGG